MRCAVECRNPRASSVLNSASRRMRWLRGKPSSRPVASGSGRSARTPGAGVPARGPRGEACGSITLEAWACRGARAPREGRRRWNTRGRVRLDAEALAALATTGGKDLAATASAHPDHETVGALATPIVGLESSLHGVLDLRRIEWRDEAMGRRIHAPEGASPANGGCRTLACCEEAGAMPRALLCGWLPGLSRGKRSPDWTSAAARGGLGVRYVKSSGTQELGAARMLAPSPELDNRPAGCSRK